VRLATAVAAAGMDLQAAALGINALALAEADVAGRQRCARKRAVSVHRLVNGADIADAQQDNAIFRHVPILA